MERTPNCIYEVVFETVPAEDSVISHGFYLSLASAYDYCVQMSENVNKRCKWYCDIVEQICENGLAYCGIFTIYRHELKDYNTIKALGEDEQI